MVSCGTLILTIPSGPFIKIKKKKSTNLHVHCNWINCVHNYINYIMQTFVDEKTCKKTCTIYQVQITKSMNNKVSLKLTYNTNVMQMEMY